MISIEECAKLLNEVADALNTVNHTFATAKLDEFDKICNGQYLSSDLIFNRLKIGSELLFRQGKYAEGLSVLDRHMDMLQSNPIHAIEILKQRARFEMVSNRFGISISSLSKALGIAESINDNKQIYDIYVALSRMFSSRYSGLSLYFIRKAEILSSRNNYKLEAILAKIDRALISYQTYLLNRDNEEFKGLLHEARDLVQIVDVSEFNPMQKRHYRFVRAIVMEDVEDLSSQVDEAESSGMLPATNIVMEAYIAACIESGENASALKVLDRYLPNIEKRHGLEARANLEVMRPLLLSDQKINFIPFHISKPDGEPTNLLDILDHFSIGEELWSHNQGRFSGLFPGFNHEGMFEAIVMPDGKTRLWPCNLAFNDYYRGQASYFEQSNPSLFRKGMSDADIFVERLKHEEFKLLMQKYPLTQIFAETLGATMPDNSVIPLSLSIDYLALSQHYGIKTELMDVTVDKFVAAFFASTTCKDDVYTPIIEPQKEMGVFYHYVNIPFPGEVGRMRAVGLQPASRPGEQAGFVVEMKPEENFNNCVRQAIRFVHVPEIAEFIFNYTNRSRKLFPDNWIKVKADIIKSSNTFSREAFRLAVEEFYEGNEGKCQSFLSEKNINLSDSPIVDFSEDEKAECIRRWNEKGFDEIQKKVIIRPIYHGPFNYIVPNKK